VVNVLALQQRHRLPGSHGKPQDCKEPVAWAVPAHSSVHEAAMAHRIVGDCAAVEALLVAEERRIAAEAVEVVVV